MSKINNLKLPNIILCCSLGAVALSESGCAPVAVVGGGGAAMVTASEKRGFKGVYDDTAVSSKISYAFEKKGKGLFGVVSPTVRNGVVLLTGTVRTQTLKDEAGRIAESVEGVQTVHNEVKVGEDSIGAYANDTWISTKLKTDLIATKGIHSTDFTFETVDGVVYLMGTVRSQAEIDRALQVARSIKGVKRAVSFCHVAPHKAAS